MNADKTETMTNTRNIRRITVNEQDIETVNEYFYLGQFMKIDKEYQTSKIMRELLSHGLHLDG